MQAYRCFLERTRVATGLKGLFEYATHPSRARELAPALLRHVSVAPTSYSDDEDAWTVSKGLAFHMYFAPVTHSALRRRALSEMATRLWSRRIQIWGDAESSTRSFPWAVDLFQRKMDGDSTAWESEAHQGPVDWIGHGAGETLWVRSDTGNQDLQKALGPTVDPEWAERVRLEVLAEYGRAIKDAVRASLLGQENRVEGDDDPDIAPEAAQDVIAELKESFVLQDPLDPYEGWCRQKVMGCASSTGFRLNSLRVEHTGAVDICPRRDGSLWGVAWRVAPFPSRELVIDTFWPANARTKVSRDMPASLSDPAWLPFLYAWPRTSFERLLDDNRRQLDRIKAAVELAAESQPALLVAVDRVVVTPDASHPRAHEWVAKYSAAASVLIRFHEGLEDGMTATLDHALLDSLMQQFVRRLGEFTSEKLDGAPTLPSTWPSGRPAMIVPAWHNGTPVTVEQAVFGSEGMALVSRVEDWPEDLRRSFGLSHRVVGGDDNTHVRGPANLLRRGLGTWVNRSITPKGQDLLYRVLTNRSPVALRSYDMLGPCLQSLDRHEALALSQLLGCESTGELWGHEFSWDIAFALGGSLHAAIEVRPALQERMQLTNISAEMPGWTLQGPSELSFMQFGNALHIGTRKCSDRTADRVVVGAYIWSKERHRITGEPVPLGTHAERGETILDIAIALVGSDRYSGKPTDREPNKGWALAFFKDFSWTGLDADMSINDMLVALSDSLEQAKVAEGSRESTYKSDTYDEDSLEDLRLDRAAFEVTMKELTKVLLYMQMREARIEREEKHYGDNVGRGENPLLPPKSKDPRPPVPGAKPRETILRKIRVGPIRIDDEPETSSPSDGSSGRKVAPHPRMGHIRLQACGPRWRDHKPIWIKPQWIGMKGGVSGPPRLYDVG